MTRMLNNAQTISQLLIVRYNSNIKIIKIALTTLDLYTTKVYCLAYSCQ